MYAKEFIVGCIGSVITIFATAALLKSQSASEIKKEQISGIFKEKLRVYMSFIEFLNEIHEDGVLTHEELKKLVEWGSKLALFCRPGVIRQIYDYIVQISAFGTSDYQELSLEEKTKWKKWQAKYYTEIEDDFENDEVFCEAKYSGISNIISTLRDDLVENDMPDINDELNIESNIFDLWQLHAVVDIEIDDESCLIVTTDYEKSKRKPRKPRKSSAKKGETDRGNNDGVST
jgi:hypothetical protein